MLTRERQIIAMGGGAFAKEHNLAIDRYIIAQARRRKRQRACFIPTATGDSREYIVRFYDAYTSLGCIPSHLELFSRTPDIRSLLLNQDVIYVGGGNTKSMLAVWHDWGVPAVLKQAWRAGIVLCGISAGAICWFEAGSTDSWADRLAPLECLGFLRGGCAPHYDVEKDRRPTVQRQVRTGKLPTTLALDNGVAAHFIGRRLLRLVSDRDGAHGYRIRRKGGRVEEQQIDPQRLRSS